MKETIKGISSNEGNKKAIVILAWDALMSNLGEAKIMIDNLLIEKEPIIIICSLIEQEILHRLVTELIEISDVRIYGRKAGETTAEQIKEILDEYPDKPVIYLASQIVDLEEISKIEGSDKIKKLLFIDPREEEHIREVTKLEFSSVSSFEEASELIEHLIPD